MAHPGIPLRRGGGAPANGMRNKGSEATDGGGGGAANRGGVASTTGIGGGGACGGGGGGATIAAGGGGGATGTAAAITEAVELTGSCAAFGARGWQSGQSLYDGGTSLPHFGQIQVNIESNFLV